MKTNRIALLSGIAAALFLLALGSRAVAQGTPGKSKLAPSQPSQPAPSFPSSAPVVPTDNAQANQLAQEALRLMQYNRLDDAETRLRMALFRDPSNSLAQSLMEQLKAKKEEMKGRELRKKLETMIVEEVDFHAVPLSAVIDFIADESRKLSPDGDGVNFVLKVPESKEAVPITLKLRKIPLMDVLKYTCQFAGVEMNFEKFAVIITPAQPSAP